MQLRAVYLDALGRGELKDTYTSMNRRDATHHAGHFVVKRDALRKCDTLTGIGSYTNDPVARTTVRLALASTEANHSIKIHLVRGAAAQNKA